MNGSLRFRFWLEAALATLTGLLLVVTLVWREWIELLFGVEPDGGDGSLEVGIVAGLALATVLLSVLARAERRRADATG